MRLTSEMFAAAVVRRVFSDGGFAAVVRRGADAAGAVFVVLRDRQGAIRLLGPAPQTMADDGGERRFVAEDVADEEALERRFAREARFDPDFWVLELETEGPDRYLTIVEAD
ncbi:DUF1491 family protein [Aureimonas flava]|uniref:DUF1491 family protein n=1 Tax=Aureimonas flava TaxID=2320271 RepID=A0A3A1WLK1_9HYPH|nr:DUF1491 family protein [Aureimonas flava]RIY01275.1 DUF1491 family protein [Aureimonas flava]